MNYPLPSEGNGMMPGNGVPQKANLHAILFPHSGLSEEGMERVLSLFEGLTVFQPWHMDPPEWEGVRRSTVEVLHPPETMNPVSGFKSLLSEYRGWMRQNVLKGYTPLLRVSLGDHPEESTTQEIKDALRPRQKGKAILEPCPFTRWHLVLHLNRLMEEQEEEARRALRALRKGGSPLKGVLEEETEAGLFDDLPPFESSPLTEAGELEHLCDAWFGLFGGLLGAQGHLVTLNRHLLGHLSGTWEECYGPESLEEHSAGWFWPDLSGIGPEALAQERARIFLDGRAGELWSALQQFRKEPGEAFPGVRRASERLDRSWGLRYSPAILGFSVRYFPRFSEEPLDSKGKALERVRGRAIFLVEEAFRDEAP